MIRKWSCSELWRSAKSWSIDLWRVLGSLRPPDQKAVSLISKIGSNNKVRNLMVKWDPGVLKASGKAQSQTPSWPRSPARSQ